MEDNYPTTTDEAEQMTKRRLSAFSPLEVRVVVAMGDGPSKAVEIALT